MKKTMVFLSVFVFAGISAQAGEKISGCGGLAYPPFMWKEGGKTVGVATEVAEIIFGDLGMEVESRSFSSWSRCMQEVKKGRTDMLFAASANEERSGLADFTKNHLSEVPVAVFVWKDRPFKYEKWEDLKGKKMGRILKTTYGQEFDDFAAKHLEISDVVTPIQNLKKLEKGRVDFLPIGLYAGKIHMRQFGYADKIIALEPYLEIGYLYVAISKRSKHLKHLAHADRRLSELGSDGTIRRLIDKYIDLYVASSKE